MVYYRKYRPQTVEELDLSSVRERLTSILGAKELPHAFLFTGPKGLGKTSSARILAKAINCTNKKDIEPCNECEACTSITSGSNIDVIEIDAASNRGIDEIRDLREKIKYSPSNLQKKVYIIDEVHMLTTDAFNALLKTLEEPPGHAMFILCTTELEKVPPTISSRTFHVKFHKPTKEESIRSLKRIVEGEKLKVDDKVLEKLYRFSEGSFRDAAKVLEELNLTSGNSQITEETLEEVYKAGGMEDQAKELLLALSKKDMKGAMKIVDELAISGADFKVLVETLADMIHGMIMRRVGMTSESFDIEGFNARDLKLLLEKLNDSYKNIKTSVLPQIPLELVVVGYCLEGIDVKSNTKEKASTRQEVEVEGKKEEEKVEQSVPVKEVEKEDTVSTNPTDHGALFRANAKPENFLAAFLDILKKDNHSIAGVLRGCRLIGISEGEVVFETKFKFHQDKLSESKTRVILDKRATELLKEPVHVVVNLVGK